MEHEFFRCSLPQLLLFETDASMASLKTSMPSSSPWQTLSLPPALYKRQQSSLSFSPTQARPISLARQCTARRRCLLPFVAGVHGARSSSPEPRTRHPPSVVEPCSSPPGRTPSNSPRHTREPKVDDDPNYFVYFIKVLFDSIHELYILFVVI
jgi:hypothetical protein